MSEESEQQQDPSELAADGDNVIDGIEESDIIEEQEDLREDRVADES